MPLLTTFATAAASGYGLTRASAPTQFQVTYLVIAGGGGGGDFRAGGGGAGGYRSSVTGELSGRNSTAESPLTALTGTAYSVQVGAGGSYQNGSDSVFASITSIGGGAGAGNGVSGNGGSGGGGSRSQVQAGLGTVNQGFNGGTSNGSTHGGGGGGAGEVGNTDGSGLGGDGLASTITGTSVFRGGGGGGGFSGINTDGGLGGGGRGGSIAGFATANTGGGGGGGWNTASSKPGGSGVVILKYPDTRTATFSAGVTSSTTTSGGFKITTITPKNQ